ncbi:MAG: anthranilate phosphoribosyltransferase [Actinobacteria bacterium]|nr:anthranilate phosphoribosyltransferase [Actinomycetota bacterium]
MSTPLHAAMVKVLGGENLTEDEARAALGFIMDGEATAAQTAGFLVALKAKGETPVEIAGCARAMREHAIAVRPQRTDLVDTCGTGGDHTGSFNISTAAALVAAGAGAGVAKHGNRSISSKSGSADVLEQLGIPVEVPAAAVAAMIDEHGFGFLYAPSHHPAMRHAGPVRRELAIPTIMNLLGPLANPVETPFQIIGVARLELVEPMAQVMQILGIQHALIVHGDGGFDEITPCSTTTIADVTQDGITLSTFDPTDHGIARAHIDALKGGGPEENAAIIRRVLEGEPGAPRDAVVLNAAAALVVCGQADDFDAGLARAAASIDTGQAQRVLDAVGAAARAAAERGA